MSAAFIACIGTGRLFDMLGRAGRDEKISNDVWLRAQKIYNKYFQNPNPKILAEVNAIEEELGKADDYVRSNGDAICPETLKALDFHSALGNPRGTHWHPNVRHMPPKRRIYHMRHLYGSKLVVAEPEWCLGFQM